MLPSPPLGEHGDSNGAALRRFGYPQRRSAKPSEPLQATRLSRLTGAQERVIEDAKMIVSERRDCSPDEALVRLIFVAQRTNRKPREIACEVVAAAADAPRLAVAAPRPYRFTL